MRKFQLGLFVCTLFALLLCACSSIKEAPPNIISDAESFQETLSIYVPEVPKVMETSPNTLMSTVRGSWMRFMLSEWFAYMCL